MALDASGALAARDKVQQFLNAARSGNLDLFKKLAAEFADGQGLKKAVEAVRDANQRGALHFAAIGGQSEVCEYLLEELEVDVNSRDEDGETPLIHAARKENTGTVELLLGHGADPSIASNLGATALHHSAGVGNLELMKHLIFKGVDVNSQSDSGTPLVWAAGHSQSQAVELLLKHNADPNAETDDGITPLLSSVAAGSLLSLQALIQAGGKVNIRAGGTTPLHVAAEYGLSEIVHCLLKAGADANATDEDGTKPILISAGRGSRDSVEMLLPFTSKIDSVPNWSVDGILEYIKMCKQQERMKGLQVDNTAEESPKQDLPEVTPEAKAKAADAKLRGDEAFSRKDVTLAVDAYTQAIDLDPTDGILFSNRSLCWLRLGQAEQALADAKMCKALKPDWPKAYYREGAALRQMQNFEGAATAFYEGVTLSPESTELVNAFRESVEAGRKLYGTDNEKK